MILDTNLILTFGIVYFIEKEEINEIKIYFISCDFTPMLLTLEYVTYTTNIYIYYYYLTVE